MERNPLIPLPPRLSARHAHDVRVGVHTAVDIEKAIWYAVSAAASTSEMDEPNTGIVLALDMQGLKPIPDYDAVMLEDTLGGVAEEALLRDKDGILDVENKDGETLQDKAQELIDESEYFADERITDWNTAMLHHLQDGDVTSVFSVMADSITEDQALAASKVAAETGRFPQYIYMLATGQRRYLQPVGFDRLVGVYAVHPVETDVVWDEWDEESEGPAEGEGPLYMDESYPVPPMVTLWERTPDEGADVEYHGTEVGAAREAFPKIAEFVSSPWDFEQPFNPVRWMGWSKPMGVGVGVYPIAEDTDRILVGLRSKEVQTPGHWSGFGGLLEPGESFEVAAVRELAEETGYTGPIELESFGPALYIARVPVEYEPALNWETDEAVWMELDELDSLSPRHWGLDVLMSQDI